MGGSTIYGPGPIRFDSLKVTNTDNATSSTSGGSVTVDGGCAVAKDVYVGEDNLVTGDVSATNVIISYGTTTISDSVTNPTAAQLLGGYIEYTGGDGDTITLPDGADIVGEFSSPAAGVSFRCFILNNSGGTLTYAAGSSGAVSGSALTSADTKLAVLDFVLTSDSAYHCYVNAD